MKIFISSAAQKVCFFSLLLIFFIFYGSAFGQLRNDQDGMLKNVNLHHSVAFTREKSSVSLQGNKFFYIDESERRVKFSGGVKLGYSNYTLFGNEVNLRMRRGAELHNRKNIEAGILTKFDIYKYLFVKIELNYVKKGAHLKGGGWTYQTPVKVNYLCFPFLIGVSPIKTRPITLSVEAGITYNILRTFNNGYSKDIVAGYHIEENRELVSKTYGVEVSTDAIDDITLFINYRHSEDCKFFHARVNSDTGENYDLWNKGSSLCLGIRFKTLKF